MGSRRLANAEKAVAMTEVSIALACRAFSVSETCFRYSPKRDEENEVIADLLVGLTNVHKTWGFGLCFLHLRSVKGRAIGRHWFKPNGEGLEPQAGPPDLLRAETEPADQAKAVAEARQARGTGRAGGTEPGLVHGLHGRAAGGWVPVPAAERAGRFQPRRLGHRGRLFSRTPPVSSQWKSTPQQPQETSFYVFNRMENGGFRWIIYQEAREQEFVAQDEELSGIICLGKVIV